MCGWKKASEKPISSTAMDIHRVLVVCRIKDEPFAVNFGWWNEQAGRWWIMHSNNEPEVTHWMEIPEMPEMNN